jgi:hypothetical protein
MRFPRSPFLWAVLAGLAVLLAAFVPVLWQMMQPRPVSSVAELPAPWQIERGPQGEVRALGLRLPGSTLADAAARWGDDLQVALIESRGQPLALEAYTDRWQGGGITGKLVLASNAQPAVVQRWKDRSQRRETIDANAQRWALHADDRADALRSGVAGISFLPASRMDAATLRARFGEPAQQLKAADGGLHWLYPDRGLAIAWDESSGRVLLQLVAPADFDARLRAPLAAAVSPAASAPASGQPR